MNATVPKCTAYTKIYPDPSNHPATVIIFSILYTCVFVLGLGGNLMLIWATFRHRTLQTVQNIFIVNLGVSDVILCLLSIPFTPITHISKEWYFGSLMCKVVSGIQAFGCFIATFSLCAIAVDRYFRLVLAPNRPLRKQHALRLTAALWVLALLGALPYAYHMTVYRMKGVCGRFCTEKWPNDHSKRIYTFFVMVVQFVIPFTIMAICYHSIFAFLRKRATTRLTSITQQANLLYVLAATAGGDSAQHKEQGSSRRDSLVIAYVEALEACQRNGSHASANNEPLLHLIEQKRRVLSQRRRVTLILLTMVLLFGGTALPHNVISLVQEYSKQNDLMHFNDTDFTYLVNVATHFLAMVPCVTNPILYAFLNPEFRDLVLNKIKWAPYFVSRSFAPTQTSYL